MTLTSVPTGEFERRITGIREDLAAEGADALCLFSGTDIEWLSGFYHLQTERPVCLAATEDAVAITVPRLERDRATDGAFPTIDEVYGYYDYPGGSDADVDVETVEWIRERRTTKSDVEIALLRESATWGNLAHRTLSECAEPGRHELWAAKRASLDASMSMLNALGDRYESHLRGGFPASRGFLAGSNRACTSRGWPATATPTRSSSPRTGRSR